MTDRNRERVASQTERGVQPSPSARRATEIVAFLTRRPEGAFSVSEIARALGLNRATCHSVLLALEAADYVRRDERTKGYSLGAGLVSAGEAALSSMTVVREARPEVERLAATTGVECAAAVPAGDEMVLVATAGPHDRFGAVRVGATYPLCPPFATAFVAWGDEAAVEGWLGRAGALTDEQRRHYLASLDAVRRRGYSLTLGVKDPARLTEALAAFRAERTIRSSAEVHRHVVERLQQEYLLSDLDPAGGPHRIEQVTVPVFDDLGRVPLVIGLTAFPYDVTLDQVANYVAPLFAASRRISGRLTGLEVAAPPV